MTVPALAPTYTPYPMEIHSGRGDRICTKEGRSFYDFYGGHCVASTGHAHPKVVAAIAEQAQALLFYSTAGNLPIRHRAAQTLLDFAQCAALKQVFFCNSGAEANENAIKISRLVTGKSRVAGLSGGWHGRSLACLSVTDDEKITAPYQSWLLPSLQLAFEDLAALEAADFSDLACIMVEPIQSLAGVRSVSDGYLRALRAKADRFGSLLIFDEIQTGFGRTGAPFAASHAAVQPDLLTAAKGIASGLPMAGVLMSEAVALALKPQDLGSTFGGGPLACAAMLATIAVINEEHLCQHALDCEALLRTGCAALGLAPLLGKGLLLGLTHPYAKAFKDYAFQQNILLGASSHPQVLRLMPPLNISTEAIQALLQALADFNPA